MPGSIQVDKPYLIAKPAGFPGLEIPLHSDEECKARGIVPAKWPPRETWTQAQRDAADKLTDLLLPQVLREVMQLMLAELERIPTDSTLSESDQERHAARQGISLVDSRKWKQRDTAICFPRQWIQDILELIASGRLSLLDPSPPKQKKGTRKKR